MKKRAQAWGFDLMMGAVIFTLGLILFFIYSINYPRQSEETLDVLRFEGEFIAENLLSTGHPNDWTENNVIAIGLVNEEKINQTKIERLYTMTSSQAGYDKSKSLLNTRYEFFFNFSQQMFVAGNPVEGIGKDYVNQNTKNLVKITRIVIYDNSPTTLNLYIWE